MSMELIGIFQRSLQLETLDEFLLLVMILCTNFVILLLFQ